jgi:hypothetical protein
LLHQEKVGCERVKICEEGVRRGDWPIGRVVDVFPGQYGVVRVAKVRPFHGYLVQPVAKLMVIVLDKGTENCIGYGVPIRGGVVLLLLICMLSMYAIIKIVSENTLNCSCYNLINIQNKIKYLFSFGILG